jgi:hypothetical protein
MRLIANDRSLRWYCYGDERRSDRFGITVPTGDMPMRQVQWDGPPIKPGTRRGMISNSPFEINEDSYHYHVLEKVAEQQFRVSSRFMDTLFAWWGPRPPVNEGLASCYRTLGANKGRLARTDAFYDTRGRVYSLSGDSGSLQNSRLSRAAMEAPEPVDVRGGWSYALEIFQHEGWATTVDEANAVLSTPTTDFMAVRAAIAILEVAETGKTAFLLEQDATCSGFQHMALLTRDRALAEAVNATVSDVRGDLYALLAEECAIAAYFEITDRAARSFVKPIVMLTGYGSGAHGLALRYWVDFNGEVVVDEETGKDRAKGGTTITIHNRTFSYDDLVEWVKPMQAALFDKFPVIKTLRNRCMAFFEDTVQKGAKDLTWTTPNGFLACKVLLKGDYDLGNVTSAGAMPNLIHSLDACVVQNVIAAWDGVLGVVHDAFFTTVDRALELREAVRAAYADVHSNLGDFPLAANKAPLPVGLCIGV